MRLIASSLTPPAMQMTTMYRQICLLRRFLKSERTLRTYPGLAAIISDNFIFQVFGHIFGEFNFILRFHLKCDWLQQLHHHRQCRWWPYVARFAFSCLLGSPYVSCRLVLNFIKPFLKSFIGEFSAQFSTNPTESSTRVISWQRPARAEKVSAAIMKCVTARLFYSLCSLLP